MTSTVTSLDHPIIFVLDPSNGDTMVPDHDPASLAASTSSCISVRAMAYVDGEVTIWLERDPEPTDQSQRVLAISRSISAPSQRVAVVDSGNNILLEMEAAGTKPLVDVFVDNVQYPGTIWIEVH